MLPKCELTEFSYHVRICMSNKIITHTRGLLIEAVNIYIIIYNFLTFLHINNYVNQNVNRDSPLGLGTLGTLGMELKL